MIRKIKIQGYRIHKNLPVEPNRKFNLIARRLRLSLRSILTPARAVENFHKK